MADPTKYNLTDAALPNGTIDFYTLLGTSPSATEDELRGKIQAIYSESQANRDHRNLNKRREYQTLLELLPAARAALLEAPKRSRYDQYLTSAQNDAATVDFETFMNDLMGSDEQMEDKTALLGTADRREPRVKVIKTPTPTADTKTTAASASSGASAGSSGGNMAIVGAIIGLLVGAGIGYAATKNAIVAIIAGLVVGAIGFVAMNRKPGGKVGV
jgi:hypothetical protein